MLYLNFIKLHYSCILYRDYYKLSKLYRLIHHVAETNRQLNLAANIFITSRAVYIFRCHRDVKTVFVNLLCCLVFLDCWLIIKGLHRVLHLVNKEFWKVIDPSKPPEPKTATHSLGKTLQLIFSISKTPRITLELGSGIMLVFSHVLDFIQRP